MKTLDTIIETLRPLEPLSIIDMSVRYKCDVYDIIPPLLKFGMVELSDHGFKLSKNGKDNSDGLYGLWNVDVCMLVLYDLIINNRIPKHIGEKINRIFDGDMNYILEQGDTLNHYSIIKIKFGD
jgi:hypothetical protein